MCLCVCVYVYTCVRVCVCVCVCVKASYLTMIHSNNAWLLVYVNNTAYITYIASSCDVIEFTHTHTYVSLRLLMHTNVTVLMPGKLSVMYIHTADMKNNPYSY